MKTAHFRISRTLCGDCSLALRRFVGGMDGVTSVETEDGAIAVRFDEERIDERKLAAITKGSIERLGYRLEE